MSLNDFLNVIRWLGSISDLFHYLEARAALLDYFDGVNQEAPVLSFYILRSKSFSEFRSEDADRYAERFQLHMLENLKSYEERDRSIARVHDIIQKLHDREPTYREYVPSDLLPFFEPDEARQMYLTMGALLNALSASLSYRTRTRLYFI